MKPAGKTMKKIIVLIIVLSSFSSNAQSLIFNLEDKDQGWQTGAYYKDNNNLLTPYVGTFIYTNDTTAFKIVMRKKKVQHYMNYYERI